MSLPLPPFLSPPQVSAFKGCALAFRFAEIDHLPAPASPWAVKGTLIHRALELLFWEEPAGHRSLRVGREQLERARAELPDGAEFVGLALSADDEAAFVADAETLVRGYYALED